LPPLCRGSLLPSPSTRAFANERKPFVGRRARGRLRQLPDRKREQAPRTPRSLCDNQIALAFIVAEQVSTSPPVNGWVMLPTNGIDTLTTTVVDAIDCADRGKVAAMAGQRVA
jgi:hypothetical protein